MWPHGKLYKNGSERKCTLRMCDSVSVKYNTGGIYPIYICTLQYPLCNDKGILSEGNVGEELSRDIVLQVRGRMAGSGGSTNFCRRLGGDRWCVVEATLIGERFSSGSWFDISWVVCLLRVWRYGNRVAWYGRNCITQVSVDIPSIR